MDKEKGKEGVVNHTFTTINPNIQSQIRQLGHAFTLAVAEGENELAQQLIKEALILKENAR